MTTPCRLGRASSDGSYAPRFVRGLGTYVRELNPDLPRSVWTLEAGGLANSLGNGIVLPFVIIYLHQVRGISLATAGLVVATLGAVGLVSGPLAGRVVDWIGARATLMCSLGVLAIGYGAFPLVRESWQAFGLAAIAGIGNGAFAPSHSALLAGLTTRDQRHAAYALQRVTDNLGFGIGGLVGGLIATTAVPESFTVLFLLDAGTFAAFIAMLAFIPAPPAVSRADAALGGGYAVVLRDRLFLAFLALIAVYVACAYAQLAALLPVFAKKEAGVSEAGIGVIFFLNTAFIVVAQLPIARALEGRRRLRALALAGGTYAAAWVLVFAGGEWLQASSAAALLALAVTIFAVGECLHGAIQNPLIVDLAPPHLLGRYMALRSIAWQLGFMVGPALGALVLAHSPGALWLGAAAACVGASVGAVALEARVPGDAQRTPERAKPRRLATRLSG